MSTTRIHAQMEKLRQKFDREEQRLVNPDAKLLYFLSTMMAEAN